MATTPGGLPYPVGTDFVVDGDNAIRALAEAIDPKFPRAWTAIQPSSAADWGTSATNPPQYRRVEDFIELRGVLMYNQVASAGLIVIAGVNVPPQPNDSEGYQIAPMYGDSQISQANMCHVWVPADGGLRVRFFAATNVGARVTLDGIKYRAKS